METNWDKPRKPSPFMFLTGLGEIFKESVGIIFFGMLISFFRSGKKEEEGFNLLKSLVFVGIMFGVFILLRIPKLLGWFFTRFWVTEHKAILVKGLLTKQRIELPIDKIQTIQLKQDFMHRFTNTCAFVMDTGGSAEPEFVIDAMKREDAMALQEWLRSKQGNQATETVQDTQESIFKSMTLFHLKTLDFLKLCISENHLKSLMIILVFVISKAADIIERLGIDGGAFIRENASLVKMGFQAAIALLLIGLIIAMLYSVVRVIIRYYDYEVRQSDSVFDVSWGLLTRHKKTMPFARVEFLTWSGTWLRTKMDLFALRFHSLAESFTERDLHIQVPVTNKQMLKKLTSIYAHDLPEEKEEKPFGIQKAYVFRKLLLIGMPLSIVSGAIIYYYYSWYALIVLIWLAYFIISSFFYYQNFKIWVVGDNLQIQRGVWGRENLLVSLQKIIHVSIRTSPWQRRHGYATLDLHLPGAVWTIPYLKIEQARFWADYITLKIEEE